MADHAPMTETYDCVLSPELVKNEFPNFAPDNNSYARKHLSKELWDKLKDKKSGYGWTMARAVNTGVLNTDSLVGCHAGDTESYELFGEFFDPVIEEYHKGYSKDKKHVTDMDPAKLKGEISDPSTVKSTRIRVGRNLAGFPLNPSGTKESRLNVEALMKKVFETLTGDLAGTYYSLATLTDAERAQLVADHFLFRPGDRFQAASGYHNYWPAGRGIFHNKDKTFLLWINEGDHIRIISMQPGGDVKEVFSRLTRGAKAIEEGIKKVTGNKEAFQHTEHLGMITCCPSNLGTGLRGSVHITLPKLFKSHSLCQLQDMTRAMGCQTRGTDGEHTEITHTADISNLYRIGHTEYELVQMMIDAANALIEKEKKFKSTETYDCVMSPELAKNEFPNFAADNKSFACKHLTKEIWDKLKDKKSAYGWTMARAVNTGVLNTDSLVGCHAGDTESYELFGEFFDPVIEEYHKGYSKDKKHVTDMDPTKLKGEISDPSTVKSSRIRVGRNLFGFPLNPSSTKEDRLNVEALMKKVFDTLTGDLAGTYYSLATLTDAERAQLVADHFLFRPGDRFQAASGYHNFWPAGRGIFHNKDKTFLLWINEGDHIRIISMQPGGDVKEVFSRLTHGAKAIEEGIKKVTGNKEAFQHTDHLGMITCCPSNLGTGLRGSVHITLPKLFKSHCLSQLQDMTRAMGCQTRGTDGEHTEITHTADISNLYRIGHTEYELVQMMIDAANAMIKKEKSSK